MTLKVNHKRLERVREASAWAALGFLVLLGGGFIVLCFRTGSSENDVSLNLAVLGASSVFGWLAGTLMTPGTPREEVQFGATSKAIATFASGYLVAKVDHLVTTVLEPKTVLESASVLPAFRILMAAAAFAEMLLYAYILRVHILRWVPTPDAPPPSDANPTTAGEKTEPRQA